MKMHDALAIWLYTKYTKFSCNTIKEDINWITNREWPVSPAGAQIIKEVYIEAREIIKENKLVMVVK
jgi:hypothetical protein